MGKALLSAWKPEESLFSQLLQGWTQAPPDPRHGGPKLLLDEQLRGTETSLLTVLLPWHLPKDAAGASCTPGNRQLGGPQELGDRTLSH